MKQEFFNLKISTTGQKLYEFTDQTTQWINNNKFKNGDKVKIIECKPFSKTKKFQVMEDSK